MTIAINGAIGAYGRAAGLSPRPAAAPAATATPGEGFGALVTNLMDGTAQQLHAADGAARAEVAGQGNLIDLVTSMGAAQTALDTVVAVRDRVVSAYGEIMRMQL